MMHPSGTDLIGMGMFGGALAYFKAIPVAIWTKLKSYFTVTLEVPNTEQSTNTTIIWVETWLDSIKKASHKNLKAVEFWDEKTGEAQFNLAPDAHYYPFWTKYKNVRLLVRCYKRDTQQGAVLYDYSFYFFTRNSQIVTEFLAELRDAYKEKHKGSVISKVWGGYEWQKGQRVKQRSFDSVVLPLGQIEALRADIDIFLKNEKLYQDTGIIHKRGYLFYGIPGAGKSSLARAIASYMKWNLYIFTPSSVGKGELTKAFAGVKSKSIVLLEDIDTFKIERNEDSSESSTQLTGDWLNFLDGINSPEDTIFIMTTNNIDLLDPALIRDGRVDFKLHFDYASEEQIKRAYKHFNPEASESELNDFYSQYADRQVTMSEVQNTLFHKLIPTNVELE